MRFLLSFLGERDPACPPNLMMAQGCRLTLLLGMTLLLTLPGCAISPHNEYVSDVDFYQYRTFAWAPQDVHDVQNPILDSAILSQRVKNAVRGAMIARGYTEAGMDADLVVTYHTASKERIEAIGYGIGMGYHSYYHYWRHSIHFAARDIETYEDGVLIIDVIDQEKDRLIWRGWESARLTQQNFSEPQVQLMVTRILSRFPPT